MLHARFYLDYIDPGSFLVDRRLARLEGAGQVVVERLPWEVRRPPEALLEPEHPGWTGYWSQMAAEARSHGLELVRPTLVPWTRKAHELAMMAREKGCFERVHQDLMSAFHLEGRDLGRVDVLVSLGQGAGLDFTETKAVLDVDRHAAALDEVREEAVQAGVRGVPTLVCEGELLEGVPSVEELRAFLDGLNGTNED